MFSVEEIVKKIREHSEASEEEIRKLIAEKQEELSGLVSEEGAAYIVARELGVNLLKETKRQLKIKNLVPGLRSVELVARVVRIQEPREFERNGKQGKVVNIVLGDETGTVRLSLWNDECEIAERINEGGSVRIFRAYTKEDSMGNPELRIGRGSIEKIDQVVNLPPPESIEERFGKPVRREIAEFGEGQFNETRAALVQAFNRNPFYEVCPVCGSRVKENEGKWRCEEHGEVTPEKNLVLSGVIDDGTGNIRAVMFRSAAEKVFGKDVNEIEDALRGKGEDFQLSSIVEGLGREFIFRGRVKRNSYSGNLEFVVNEVEDVDAKREAENLIQKIESMDGEGKGEQRNIGTAESSSRQV